MVDLDTVSTNQVQPHKSTACSTVWDCRLCSNQVNHTKAQPVAQSGTVETAGEPQCTLHFQKPVQAQPHNDHRRSGAYLFPLPIQKQSSAMQPLLFYELCRQCRMSTDGCTSSIQVIPSSCLLCVCVCV